MNKYLNSRVLLPIYLCKVEAGFPSPAENYVEQELDLKEHLIRNSDSTFLVRATGKSMVNVGIFPGDILIVDKSLEAKNNSIIIVSIDGELTVKRLIKDNENKKLYLKSENLDYPNIDLKIESDTMIWGVVTYSIHKTT
jgi:DNA polymerase V